MNYKAKDVISLINHDLLINIGKNIGVDKINHKITGAFILKTIVYLILRRIDISLRSIVFNQTFCYCKLKSS